MDIERRFLANIKAIGARIWLVFGVGIRVEIAALSQSQNATGEDRGDFGESLLSRKLGGIDVKTIGHVSSSNLIDFVA